MDRLNSQSQECFHLEILPGIGAQFSAQQSPRTRVIGMDGPNECDRLSDAVLAEIQLEVDRGNCPSILLEPVCVLLAEVKTLRSQVELLRRVSKWRHSKPASDTALI